MKFNLSNFLQLDTKELLAVNGGSLCSGPTTGPSNNASDPTSPSYGNGGGSSALVSESNWSINGTAVEHSVYVPLN